MTFPGSVWIWISNQVDILFSWSNGQYHDPYSCKNFKINSSSSFVFFDFRRMKIYFHEPCWAKHFQIVPFGFILESEPHKPNLNKAKARAWPCFNVSWNRIRSYTWKLEEFKFIYMLDMFLENVTSAWRKRAYGIKFIPHRAYTSEIHKYGVNPLLSQTNLKVELKYSETVNLVKSLLEVFRNEVYTGRVYDSSPQILRYQVHYPNKNQGITLVQNMVKLGS